MMKYQLSIEVPRSSGLHPMYRDETDDLAYAERWCSGAATDSRTLDLLRKGYVLTAKHHELGLKNEHGAYVEQVACLGRCMTAQRGRPHRITLCTPRGFFVKGMLEYADAIGLKEARSLSWVFRGSMAAQDIGTIWIKEGLKTDKLLRLAHAMSIHPRLIVMASCKALALLSEHVPNSLRDTVSIRVVEDWTMGGEPCSPQAVQDSREADLTRYASFRFVSACKAITALMLCTYEFTPQSMIDVFAEELDTVWLLEDSRTKPREAFRSIIKLPDIVYGAIAMGHTLKL